MNSKPFRPTTRVEPVGSETLTTDYRMTHRHCVVCTETRHRMVDGSLVVVAEEITLQGGDA